MHSHYADFGAQLEALIDEHKLDEVFAIATLHEIASAWNCYHRRDADTYLDDDWWAITFWLTGSPVWENEEVLREGLVALLHGVDDEFVGHVGAGPLEDFVADDESRLAWISEQASTSERFRRAIAVMYVWGVEPDSVAEHIERAAGVPLPRPKSWPPRD